MSARHLFCSGQECFWLIWSCRARSWGQRAPSVAVETCCCSAQQHGHSHLHQQAVIRCAGPGVRPVQPSVGLSGAGQHPVAAPVGTGPALSALQAPGQQAAAGSSAESSAQRGNAMMEAAGTDTLPLSR